VRQVSPRAWPGGTATGVTSPGNTAEPSGELSVGEIVAVGEAGLAVGRVGWTQVSGGLNEVRIHEQGTHPLPVRSRLPDTADRLATPCPDQGAI